MHRYRLQLTYINIIFVTLLLTKYLKPMKLEPDKIMRIIEIIVTAILSIAGTLLIANCTATMSISKYNTSSPQQIEQTTTSSVDSTTIDLK